jgi:hypothetical protein
LITLTATPADGSTVQTFYALANASGAWSLDTSIAGTVSFNGTPNNNTYTNTALSANKVYTLRATQTDVSGNVSAVSVAQVVNYDTVALAPVLNTPNTSASQTLSGTGEAGATVRVYDGTASVGTATVGANGTWSLNVSNLASGSHSFKVEQTDRAGNLSSQSAAQDVTVDTSKPTAPVLALANDTGILGDRQTNATTPGLSGTGTANTAVEIWDTFNGVATKVGTATTDATAGGH